VCPVCAPCVLRVCSVCAPSVLRGRLSNNTKKKTIYGCVHTQGHMERLGHLVGHDGDKPWVRMEGAWRGQGAPTPYAGSMSVPKFSGFSHVGAPPVTPLGKHPPACLKPAIRPLARGLKRAKEVLAIDSNWGMCPD
jgi:hypothetical protein